MGHLLPYIFKIKKIKQNEYKFYIFTVRITSCFFTIGFEFIFIISLLNLPKQHILFLDERFRAFLKKHIKITDDNRNIPIKNIKRLIKTKLFETISINLI